MTTKIQFFFFFFLVLFNMSTATAQGTAVLDAPKFSLLDGGVDSPATIFKKLNQSDVLKITIETDLDNLIQNKKRDDYQKATLTFMSEDSLEQHDIKLRPRGKFRRRTCDFPPLKIKFNKSELAEKGIATVHKSLKLVTHCMEDKGGEQALLKEFVAYKMYNKITDASFKVQLVEITFVNSAKDTSDQVKYGFIIEDTNEMAERIDGVEVENCYNITLDSISERYSNMIPMFQYMIGNLDWRPKMLQNIKVVDKKNGERIMVPYDFDFSGLVNASYAIRNVDYNQTDILQRIYVNKVDDMAELASTIKFFQLHKEEILQCIKDCEQLTKRNRKEMTRYINDFYRTLDNETLAKEAFLKQM